KALRTGRDERAAQTLFDRHARLVRRILVRTLGPFHDVEDHVQETFAAFFRQLRDLRDPDATRAFLVSSHRSLASPRRETEDRVPWRSWPSRPFATSPVRSWQATQCAPRSCSRYCSASTRRRRPPPRHTFGTAWLRIPRSSP